MNRILVISDKANASEDVVHALGFKGVVSVAPFDAMESSKAIASDTVVFDVSIDVESKVQKVRKIIPLCGTSQRVFIVPRASRRCYLQAVLLGASDVLHRPLSIDKVRHKIVETKQAAGQHHGQGRHGAAKIVDFLDFLCSDASFRVVAEKPMNYPLFLSVAQMLVDDATAVPFAVWRSQMRGTISGSVMFGANTAVNLSIFGHHLGFRHEDLCRLVLAGLTYDLGKLKLSTDMLHKASDLTAEERSTIRLHPQYGAEILAAAKAPAYLSEVARSHHEHLDGSGYPDGLQSHQISELSKIVCVVDIFSSLTAPRSYRAANDARSTLQQMATMTGQIDQALVAEFGKMPGIR